MPALPLTPEQKAEALKLKTLFKEWQVARKEKGDPYSQEAASELLGFGQSALSQYLNGAIPLNPSAAANFSRLLGCRIEDFSPSIAKQATHIAAAVTPAVKDPEKALELTDLNKLEMQLVLMYRDMSSEARDELLQHANALHNQVKPASSPANPFAKAPRPSTAKPPAAKTPKPPAVKKPKQHA